jgi:L-fuconate dehydratase
VEQARYRAPTAAGYSIAMKPASLDEYEFPRGRAWAGR